MGIPRPLFDQTTTPTRTASSPAMIWRLWSPSPAPRAEPNMLTISGMARLRPLLQLWKLHPKHARHSQE